MIQQFDPENIESSWESSYVCACTIVGLLLIFFVGAFAREIILLTLEVSAEIIILLNLLV